ncbi:MAG TPA: acyl-ACP--UDP-N-acetylglucosamine O-acyltransferase [Candidatus Omnitrophota bacterium]|nr:acyl-ACP--UDP-N-acetylglucosamine O-acyltransferase [Candidatus Omnitrophota bacterium]HPT07201.1 acyl-ACP--UDP-N-acetylglucosamine O-acyltransferase [Candidatus Omnitrophota bacterium]
MSIHKTAIVAKEAKLGKDVEVGPYAVIGGHVEIGAGTKIGAHCVVDGRTTIGENCEIFSGAVVGTRPQDLKFKDETTYLVIGNNNIIREYCTLNPGTTEGSRTVVGDGNLMMAYSHVAHDCTVGNNCVFANNSTLAGHVTIQDRAVIGGLVAIHQFVRIGKLSIIGGCSKVVQDIPPYSTCDGHPARVYGLNLVGLRRHQVARECIQELNHAYKVIFNSGHSIRQGALDLEKLPQRCPEVAFLIDFIKKSERGVSRSCRSE